MLLFLEGKGSLLYFLKTKGWATLLSAGVGSGGSQRSSVRLADSGQKNEYRSSSVSDSVHILDGRGSISFSQSAPFYFCENLVFIII